nr:hypothetical protein [uncultured Agathobaculum sp.]
MKAYSFHRAALPRIVRTQPELRKVPTNEALFSLFQKPGKAGLLIKPAV